MDLVVDKKIEPYSYKKKNIFNVIMIPITTRIISPIAYLKYLSVLFSFKSV
jgi:hypothetical protein